ncbi:MAG: TNT domain-containing protein [Acidobacteria bacterium]|jgi:hypothetical protein|nr:TNT domain-containing protein [Acidobacteriota bacterium]
MLLDPLRLGGNVPFRWTERILNTPRDILQQIDKGEIMPGSSTAKWIGGKISEQITGQPAPQMPTISESVENLTGAKLPSIPEAKVERPFEYQTEKYKREGNIGEDVGATALDLFLLKRAAFGKPNTAQQSLKTLGGLPETEIATKAAATTNNVTKVKQSAKWVDEAGNIKYPPNDGFAGVPKRITLKPGTLIDRYGVEGGKYVSPKGTTYPERALAPGSKTKPYHIYEVVKPIEGLGGKVVPWFDEPGGGIQYKFDKTIKQLLDGGYIKEVMK